MTGQSAKRILYLYGAVSQAEILNFIRTQCVINEKEIESIMSNWREAAKQFASISSREMGIPDQITIQEIPSEFSGVIESIAEDPLFKNTFSMLPISFKVVELDKLIAPQRFVNLDYVEKLSRVIPADVDMKFLIDFCFKGNPQVDAPTELQLAPNVYAYISQSTDFRFLGGFPKKLSDDDIRFCLGGGQPVAALLLFVGYGAPAVNVFKIGSRVILNNGFHRLFALRKRGIMEAPVVIQNVSNWNLELPQIIIGLQTAYLVTSPRPPLLKDFMNPQITKELLMKSRDRLIQIQWNVNQIDIPR